LLFIGLALLHWYFHQAEWHDGWLEDVPVYARAVHEWLAGSNPYSSSLAPLYFLYPPFFLFMAGLISHLLPSNWGPSVYIGFNVAATCALPLVLARYYFRRPWLGPLFALLLFFASPGFTGVRAFCTMNISSFLYCLAFVAAVPGLRRNRWQWLYLAVMLAAMIKITFLALLLLPLLAGRRQWLRSVACAASVVAGNLIEMALWPGLYGGYRWSLQQGILTERAYGYGVFGILATYHHRQRSGVGIAPYAVFLLMAAVVVILMFILRRRLECAEDLSSNGTWLALVVTAVILVNPRNMQYDVDIALFATYVLWIYALRTRHLLLWMVLLFAPSLAVPKIVLNPHMQGIYSTCLVMAVFALAYWRLWQEAGSEPPVSPCVEPPLAESHSIEPPLVVSVQSASPN
jgi:hypothetical protein